MHWGKGIVENFGQRFEGVEVRRTQSKARALPVPQGSRGRPTKGAEIEEAIDGLIGMGVDVEKMPRPLAYRKIRDFAHQMFNANISIGYSNPVLQRHLFRRFGGLKRAFDAIGAPYRLRRGFTKTGRPRGISNDEMLDALRQLLNQHGYLTEDIIQSSPTTPALSAYFTRFGSLRRAYQLIGFVPDPERIRPPRAVSGISNEVILDRLRDLLRQHGHLSRSIINNSTIGASGCTIAYRFGGMLQAYRLIGYMSNWYGERHTRPYYASDREMLDALRKLWRDQGYLSQELIKKTKWIPSVYEYYKHFGSLSEAYALIGFRPAYRPNWRKPLPPFLNRS